MSHEPYQGGGGGCQVVPGGRGRNAAGLLMLLGMITLFLRWRRSAGRMRRLKRARAPTPPVSS
jgi:hypothetical protein